MGVRRVLFSQNNVSKRHLLFSQVYTVTYNPCRVTSMSFLQVSVFSGCQLGDYFPNQVARTKILVAMAPKVVAAWRVALHCTFYPCSFVNKKLAPTEDTFSFSHRCFSKSTFLFFRMILRFKSCHLQELRK